MLYNVQKEKDRTEAEMKKILALAALNQEENAFYFSKAPSSIILPRAIFYFFGSFKP